MNLKKALKAAIDGKRIGHNNFKPECFLYFDKVCILFAVFNAKTNNHEPHDLNDYSDNFYIYKEPLTFDRVKKKCVPGKSILSSHDGSDYLYLGFTRKGRLVTDFVSGECATSWAEKEIINWSIKK